MGPCQRIILELAGRGLGGAGALAGVITKLPAPSTRPLGAVAGAITKLPGPRTGPLGALTSHVSPGWQHVSPAWQLAYQQRCSPLLAREAAACTPFSPLIAHPGGATVAHPVRATVAHPSNSTGDQRHNYGFSAARCSGATRVEGQQHSRRGISSLFSSFSSSRVRLSSEKGHTSAPGPTAAPGPKEASSPPSSEGSPSPPASLGEEEEGAVRFRVGRPRLSPIIKRAMPAELATPPASAPAGAVPGDDVAGGGDVAGCADVAGGADVAALELQFCVVGSGPAGFYTADKLLRAFPRCQVALVDRLPSPFGLVRTGVAPDHPETKFVTNQFSRVAASDRLSFFGNVAVGPSHGGGVPLAHLRRLFDAVVLSYGAEGDRRLGVPGEGLRNCLSAREFVWWYNGHPDYVHLPVDLRCTDTAIILGQGNVAIDCARVLLRSREELQMTDIASHALEALKESTIRTVHLVGRRGPAQAACTAKEVRELLGLSDVTVSVNPDDLVPSPVDEAEMKRSRSRRRVHDLLSRAAARAAAEESHHASTTIDQAQSQGADVRKSISFKFFRSPKEILPCIDPPSAGGIPHAEHTKSVPGGDLSLTETAGVPVGNQHSEGAPGEGSGGAKRVGGVRLEVTKLVGGEDGRDQKALGTGKFEDLPGGLVLRSIGYKSLPVEGAPFDSRSGIVPNVRGRVLTSRSTEAGGSAEGGGAGGVELGAGGAGVGEGEGEGEGGFERGLYVVGWLKRGPTGIIGTNEIDAAETVESILEDAVKGVLRRSVTVGQDDSDMDVTVDSPHSDTGSDAGVTVGGVGREGLTRLLESRGVRFVSWEDWKNIDWEERRHGKDVGKQREKFVLVEDMLHIAGK